MTSNPEPCPCGREAQPAGVRKGLHRAYTDCCGRYIDHWADAPAPDAESLMRSRYTAFVRGRADYLQATWHASTRPAALDLDPGARWLGLDVRAHRATGPESAEVEFVARYRVGGRAVRLHERSRFVREEDDTAQNRWYYIDGDLL